MYYSKRDSTCKSCGQGQSHSWLVAGYTMVSVLLLAFLVGLVFILKAFSCPSDIRIVDTHANAIEVQIGDARIEEDIDDEAPSASQADLSELLYPGWTRYVSRTKRPGHVCFVSPSVISMHKAN